MPIKVLDSNTIDQIAAGEVVERPSSIVKELVENSIDAGATAITVEIKNGGIDSIRVTDNGCGIKKQELRCAFLRHATSKISDADDLKLINSLGFRGEALSSIAAVSQVEIVTKTSEDLTGIRMRLEGAVESSFEEIGAPTGTTMIVRNIFFNTPVRKKFLKSALTEGSYIQDLMEHLALSHPDISIQFTIGNQTRFHTSGNGDLKEVIYRVYGREVANAVIPISVYRDGVAIHGFLGKPEQVRSNRNFEVYFINGRFIKNNLIARSIEEGYRQYLMLHKFPICFIHIEIDPEQVDVNVHPTKMDIRFSDGPSFYATLSDVIFSTLKQNEMIPGHVLDSKADLRKAQKESITETRTGKNPEPFEQKRKSDLEKSKLYEKVIASYEKKESKLKDEEFFFDDSKDSKNINDSKDNNDSYGSKVTVPEIVNEATPKNETRVLVENIKQQETNELNTPSESSEIGTKNIDKFVNDTKNVDYTFKQTNLFDEKILTRENRSKYRIIGQVFETYWLIQYERKLFIIDQHAAHEKVNYERLMTRFKNKEIASQTLLPPIIISLSGKEESVFRDNETAFANLGFEIEHFGGNEYALRAVPVDLYRHNEKELFLEVLDELAEGNSRGSYLAIEEKIANMACKASVKGGDKLSNKEIEALIDELLSLENPYNCPHGRPTIIVMSEYEMEKKFKRIVD